jgi:hypothetical protein
LPPAPQPPTGLTAQAGDGAATLRWNASPTPNVYYWLEYRANGGAWQRNNIPITTCCVFTVSYLVNGTTYEFRLRSTNLAGDSAPSNVVSARPLPAVPASPTKLWASPEFNAVDLGWTPSPSPNVMYYLYYRDLDHNGMWTRLVYPTLNSWATVSSLSYNTMYEFKVTAANAFFESASSNVVRANTITGGCTAYATPPFILNEEVIHAINTAGCTGKVWAVRVTATLLRSSGGLPWAERVSRTEYWGTVETSRYGSSLAFTGTDGPDLCALWIVKATTRWMNGNGNWVSAEMYSSVVNGCYTA